MLTVSVVMGVYNCAKTLEEAVNCIINQTYTDWEVIMFDDGSKDNTVESAESYVKNYPKKIKEMGKIKKVR